MSTPLSPILWLHDEPIPALVADPSIIVGGTALLREFLAVAAGHRGAAQLSAAVPYVGRGVVDADALLWEPSRRARPARDSPILTRF